jgi:hypothetical protein
MRRLRELQHSAWACDAKTLWAGILEAATEIRCALTRPNPEDVGGRLGLITQAVAEATKPSRWPRDATEREAVRTLAQAVLDEVQAARALAEARGALAHSLLEVFRREDVPPGSVLNL